MGSGSIKQRKESRNQGRGLCFDEVTRGIDHGQMMPPAVEPRALELFVPPPVFDRGYTCKRAEAVNRSLVPVLPMP